MIVKHIIYQRIFTLYKHIRLWMWMSLDWLRFQDPRIRSDCLISAEVCVDVMQLGPAIKYIKIKHLFSFIYLFFFIHHTSHNSTQACSS